MNFIYLPHCQPVFSAGQIIYHRWISFDNPFSKKIKLPKLGSFIFTISYGYQHIQPMYPRTNRQVIRLKKQYEAQELTQKNRGRKPQTHFYYYRESDWLYFHFNFFLVVKELKNSHMHIKCCESDLAIYVNDLFF